MFLAIEADESQIWAKIADVRDINTSRHVRHVAFMLQPTARCGGCSRQAENDQITSTQHVDGYLAPSPACRGGIWTSRLSLGRLSQGVFDQ